MWSICRSRWTQALKVSCIGLAVAAFFTASTAYSDAPSGEDLERELLALTDGARVKLVWPRNVDPEGLSLYNEADGHELVVFDTAEGAERVLVEEPGSFVNVMVTRDGKRVIWSDLVNECAWIIDYDGSNRRKLLEGDDWVVLSTRWDAEEQVEYLYTAADYVRVWELGNRHDEDEKARVYRYRLTDEGVDRESAELIWDQTGIESQFTLSADGRYAAGSFPWPNVGVIDFETNTWQGRNEGGWGCWPAMAPDNSYRYFYMRGNHAEIMVYDHDSEGARRISLNEDMPGNLGTMDCAAPRWTNHPRFLTAAYPLDGSREENTVRGDLLIGRFDERFERIEQWVQVSSSPNREANGYAWIETGVTPEHPEGTGETGSATALPAGGGAAVEAADQWPVSRTNLLFSYSNRSQIVALDMEGNPLQGYGIGPNGLRPQGQAYEGPHGALVMHAGHYVASRTAEPLSAALGESRAFSFQLRIHPADMLQQGDIFSVPGKDDQPNIVLSQRDNRLLLALGSADEGAEPEPVELMIMGGAAVHVAVTWQDGELRCYRDGQRVYPRTGSEPPVIDGPDVWEVDDMILGDADNRWAGRIQKFAFHSDVLTPEEVAAEAAMLAALEADRAPAPRLRITGRLLEKSSPPDLTNAPYYRGLSVYLYEVDALEGEPLEGVKLYENIRVAHWTVFDREAVLFTQVEEGQMIELVLEPFERHEDVLGPEFLVDTVADLEAPMFFDVGGSSLRER